MKYDRTSTKLLFYTQSESRVEEEAIAEDTFYAYAHKAILMSRCPYFAATLRGGWQLCGPYTKSEVGNF